MIIKVSHIEFRPIGDKFLYTVTGAAGKKFTSWDTKLSTVNAGESIEADVEDKVKGTITHHNIKSWHKMTDGKTVQPELEPTLQRKDGIIKLPTPLDKELKAKYRNVALMQAVEFCKGSPMASPDLITDTADKFYSWLVKNA